MLLQFNIEYQKKDSTQKKIEMIDVAIQEINNKLKTTEESVPP